MKLFRPGVGRVLPAANRRQDTETPDAKAARLERMAFYSTRRWRRCASLYLARFPLCHWCGRLASMVDHIIPRLTRPDLAYDETNFRPACVKCHSIHGEKAIPPGGGTPRLDAGAIPSLPGTSSVGR